MFTIQMIFLWKIASSFEAKNLNKPESGGFIWHTTGSGKTLTSFKAARLATKLDGIDKVLFVVDRKDLDDQTMREYQKFARESVNGSANTAALKRNLAKDDNRIIVTTIQKLNNLMKSEETLDAYNQRVVFMFDECHRGQFGEAQRNLKRKFKRFCQFGFTGTPIFPENAAGAATTCAFEIGRAAARKLGTESERRTNLKCSAWRKIQATENKVFPKNCRSQEGKMRTGQKIRNPQPA